MDGLCGWMTNVTLFPPFSRLVRVDENLLQPREWDPSFLPHTPPRHLLFGDGIYQATCTLHGPSDLHEFWYFWVVCSSSSSTTHHGLATSKGHPFSCMLRVLVAMTWAFSNVILLGDLENNLLILRYRTSEAMYVFITCMFSFACLHVCLYVFICKQMKSLSFIMCILCVGRGNVCTIMHTFVYLHCSKILQVLIFQD